MKKLTVQGFTLIELLVVVAIIGVLMTVASVNFIGVRERARDAERKSDLSQLQSALEFYRTDTGEYRASLPQCGLPFENGTAVYLKKTPCDPSNTARPYQYVPGPNRLSYSLYACLENDKDADGKATGPGGIVTCESGTLYYTVTNP